MVLGRRVLPTNTTPITSKIREEIFALFFVLIILALANDPVITEKVRTNTSVQIAIGLAVIYCLYNRIPWSVAFLLLFGVAIGFSGMLKDAYSSVQKAVDLVNPNKEEADIKSALKKTVTFEKEEETKLVGKDEEEEEEEESDTDCEEVSRYFGWESDTETENDREEKKNQLKSFVTKKCTDKA